MDLKSSISALKSDINCIWVAKGLTARQQNGNKKPKVSLLQNIKVSLRIYLHAFQRISVIWALQKETINMLQPSLKSLISHTKIVNPGIGCSLKVYAASKWKPEQGSKEETSRGRASKISSDPSLPLPRGEIQAATCLTKTSMPLNSGLQRKATSSKRDTYVVTFSDSTTTRSIFSSQSCFFWLPLRCVQERRLQRVHLVINNPRLHWCHRTSTLVHH